MIFYVALTKYKRENYMKAIEYDQTKLLSRVFDFWCQKYETTIETQMNTRLAILHNESKRKSKIFNKWYMKFNLVLQEEVNEVLRFC
jgi:hypothetical protein